MPPEFCCGRPLATTNKYGSVLLSDLGAITDVWTHVYSPYTDPGGAIYDCGYEITTQKNAQKCAQSLDMEITGVVLEYDSDEEGPGEAMGDAGEGMVAAKVADHVFFRDGEVMYYMGMGNETRLAEWYGVVSGGEREEMLRFMLKEHDRTGLAS